ncbi:MAG: PstS family phosphate ABC transporter substrate-binding protein [Deltaproteobacteria bacterium]|nr:MAG: PstS family phosphate ABC transporter substrate-binding protein [Deltaproteobacteria bacterium]
MTVTAVWAAALTAPACGGKGGGAGDGAIIKIDGSSTVYPITEAVAEEYQKAGGARVTIGVSGTGGGFKKFCGGETAITGASRPIKPSEVKACEAAGVQYVELPVAYDGIAVVVHKDNAFVDHLTVDELKKMWAPEAQKTVATWSQIRDGFPATELHLFGPGVDSGTYDYFTKAIVGTEHSSRGDYTSSEDDNVLVQGVSRDAGALGFFGFAYYAENQDKLKIVPIKSGDGAPVVPSVETVANGTYQPLSRPIFIYVNVAEAKRPEVAAFIDYWNEHGGKLAAEVGYIALPDKAKALVAKRFAARTPGSVFEGKGATVGVSVEDLLGRE